MTEETGLRHRGREKPDLSPYVGRWVAIAGDQVAGVGDTATAAERMGRRNRVRDKLVVYYVEAPGGESLERPAIVEVLQELFSRHDDPVYLVGGAVRDLLLGRPCQDLDFVVQSRAIKLAFKVGDALGLPTYVMDRDRDTARVILPDHKMTLDFTSFRGETLDADLKDRDFTINAMALPVFARSRSSVIDPVGGQTDLANQVIRQTHETALVDDPVRILRAVRLANQLKFLIDPATDATIRKSTLLIDNASLERVRDEVIKLIGGESPGDAFARLEGYGALPIVLPELAVLKGLEQSAPHHEPVLSHTISVLRWLERIELALFRYRHDDNDQLSQVRVGLGPFVDRLQTHFRRPVDGGIEGRHLLRLGALFHDAGKSSTQTVESNGRIRFLGHDRAGAQVTGYALRRLRMSKEAVKYCKSIVAGHMRPLLLSTGPSLSRRAIFRYFRSTGSAGVDIGILALADHLATYQKADTGEHHLELWSRLYSVVEQLFSHYFDNYEEAIEPTPLLDGWELIDALELRPGPEIGRLLRIITEAQAIGEVSTKEEAINLARRVTI